MTSYAANAPHASSRATEQVSRMTNVTCRLIGRFCSRFILLLLSQRLCIDNLSQTEQLRADFQSFAARRGGIDFKSHFVSGEVQIDDAPTLGKALSFADGEHGERVQVAENRSDPLRFRFADKDEMAV